MIHRLTRPIKSGLLHETGGEYWDRTSRAEAADLQSTASPLMLLLRIKMVSVLQTRESRSSMLKDTYISPYFYHIETHYTTGLGLLLYPVTA